MVVGRLCVHGLVPGLVVLPVVLAVAPAEMAWSPVLGTVPADRAERLALLPLVLVVLRAEFAPRGLVLDMLPADKAEPGSALLPLGLVVVPAELAC